MRRELVGPRRFFTVDVDATNLLDLRVSEHRDAVALDLYALRGPWEPCQRVGLAAHQLGLHGIIAPAATRLGLTLALFEHNLPAEQWPTIAVQSEWAHLPPDAPPAHGRRAVRLNLGASGSATQPFRPASARARVSFGPLAPWFRAVSRDGRRVSGAGGLARPAQVKRHRARTERRPKPVP